MSRIFTTGGRPSTFILNPESGGQLEISTDGALAPSFAEGESVDLEVVEVTSGGPIFIIVYDADGAVRLAVHATDDTHLRAGTVLSKLGLDLEFEPWCSAGIGNCLQIDFDRGHLRVDGADIPLEWQQVVPITLGGVPYWFLLEDARRGYPPVVDPGPCERFVDANFDGTSRRFLLLRDSGQAGSGR